MENKEQWYVFTFGCGQKFGGHYVRIWGTYNSARKKMFEEYGDEWSFQYTEEDFEEAIAKVPEYYRETLLRSIGKECDV